MSFLGLQIKHTHKSRKQTNSNVTQTNKNIIFVPVKYQMKIQIKQKIRHDHNLLYCHVPKKQRC